MEQRGCSSTVVVFILACFLLLSLTGSVNAYKNHTVGDSLGWYDKLEKPSVDYQKWAAGKNFSLGDFLIFNTDTNHSIVKTYNLTTYKLCDYDNSQDNDTSQWVNSDPSATAPHPVSVAVPLVKEGMTYFFSADYDGEQCMNGQQFKINVTHGQGLPPSLKEPSEASPGPVSPQSGSDESAPDTIVPSNFDKPIEQTDDKQASGAVSLSMCWKLMDRTVNGMMLLLLGLACLMSEA